MLMKLFSSVGQPAAPAAQAPAASPAAPAAEAPPSAGALSTLTAMTVAQMRMMGGLWIESILAQPELADPLRLERHGWKAYSQADEDGIIDEIFRRIGAPHRSFVEFGCGDGLENCTTYLLSQGWRGLWMDGNPDNARTIGAGFSYLLDHGLLQFRMERVLRENVDALIEAAGLGKEIDFLSIDVDGNDLHLWEAIRCVSARVVAIEYNPKYRPPHAWRMSYDAAHDWRGDDRMGASLQAMDDLGRALGYRLVGCNLSGNNAFFVRADLAEGRFASPATAAHLFQPARYDLVYVYQSGHATNSLNIVEGAARGAGLPWPPAVPVTGVSKA